MAKAKRISGSVHRETKITNKKTGRVQRHLSSTSRFEPIKVLKDPDDEIAVIKVLNGITLTTGYQSVRMDIGVEMPWPVRPGKFEDLEQGFKQAYELIENEITERSQDLEALLQDLAEKYR